MNDNELAERIRSLRVGANELRNEIVQLVNEFERGHGVRVVGISTRNFDVTAMTDYGVVTRKSLEIDVDATMAGETWV